MILYVLRLSLLGYIFHYFILFFLDFLLFLVLLLSCLFCFCSFIFFEPLSENAKRHAEYKGRQKTKCKQAAKATATTTTTTKIERIAGALEATAAKRIFHNFLRDKVAFAGIK